MMMKMNKLRQTLLVMSMIFAVSVPAIAADDAGFALLVQSSPVDGGNIMPGNGVHKVQVGGKIQLTAVPRTGFRFLYWVGDVGQIDTAETTVEMSSPKLVVAVFSRESFEDMLPAGVISGAAEGGAYSSAGADSGTRSYGTTYAYDDYDYPTWPEEEDDNNSTFVPEVPEPATMLLFATGAAVLARRYKRKQS